MTLSPDILKKRTKIVCTMGPATVDDDVLRQLMENGMNVARFNFSHGSHDYHRKNIERVRRIAAEEGVYVAILLDTKGPEIRTG
jgi:pyruvate kinase